MSLRWLFSGLIGLSAVSLGCSSALVGGGEDPPANGEVQLVAHRSPSATQPSTQPADSMDAAEFIQYISRPELGYISISDNLVRGKKPVAHLVANQKSLAKTGIFAAVDRDRRRTFVRREKQAGREFETLLIITPPPPNADEEEKDAWTEHVVVLVDGHRKIDCSIGSTQDGDLLVYDINIFPADGSIEVIAVSGDGEQLDVSDDCQNLDEPDVITDEAFQDTSSEDDTPVRPPPVKTRWMPHGSELPARAITSLQPVSANRMSSPQRIVLSAYSRGRS